MDKELQKWYENIKDINEITETASNINSKEFYIFQVRWYNKKSFIIISFVELNDYYKDKGYFTLSIKNFLRNNPQIKGFCLESVMDDDLYNKLIDLGWKFPRVFNGNLYMFNKKK